MLNTDVQDILGKLRYTLENKNATRRSSHTNACATLSEQLAHSADDLRLKEISEFLHGSEMNMLFNSYTSSSVSHLINKEPSELLRLRLSEPIASESVIQVCADRDK